MRFLLDRDARGERTVLVTLTDVTGSSIRAPGTHMAVGESGDSLGGFSGGCVEAAVVAEAQDAIRSAQARKVRFGAGSPYIDIRLPCGGGIDLLFQPMPPREVVERAYETLARRKPILLSASGDSKLMTQVAAPADRTGWTNAGFTSRHDPLLRVIVLGQGAEPGALLSLMKAYGAAGLLLSPDERSIEEARMLGYPAHLLRVRRASEALLCDAWTAVVTLFHDHDWETELLGQALGQAPFYIGAMGSRTTHSQRCERLLETGVPRHEIERIFAPIGLMPASRDPETLALSTLAQIVSEYRQIVP